MPKSLRQKRVEALARMTRPQSAESIRLDKANPARIERRANEVERLQKLTSKGFPVS